jgi:hypothetical protein
MGDNCPDSIASDFHFCPDFVSDSNKGVLREIICSIIGYWELENNSLFRSFHDNDIIINQEVGHEQRKNFLKITTKIFRFSYLNNSNNNYYFILKIIDKADFTSSILKLQLDCLSANPNNYSDTYKHGLKLKFNIVNFQDIPTGLYFYMGIREINIKGTNFNVLTFDGTTLPFELGNSNFTIYDLQNLSIPIFKFSNTTDLRNQSIYLIPYTDTQSLLTPPDLVDIINAKNEAQKSCLKQFNRTNLFDDNCACIDPNTLNKKDNCPERESYSDDSIILPKHCNYMGNIGNNFQRGLNACQTAAGLKYRGELKDHQGWLDDVKNDDNVNNTARNLSNIIKDENNELLTNCPMMKLGLNGIINENQRQNILNDPLVNKVVNKYIENKERFNLEIEYDENDNNEYIQNSNGEYYTNIHPLKECKKDSYDLVRKICRDYSLPMEDDPSAFVLPKKCNLMHLKRLINECNVKNRNTPDGAQGDSEQEILKRILPYEFEEEEGVCNNVRMDTMGVDNTFNTWTKMWKNHNESVENIGNMLQSQMIYEAKYLTNKTAAQEFYEETLVDLDIINNKKNCALLGRQFTGIPSGDGTNCGDKLADGLRINFIEKSLPVCLYKKNKFKADYENYINYIIYAMAFIFIFFIIYFAIKKFSN